MKEEEYYPGNVDVIYEDVKKQYVIKFRKDNNLRISQSRYYKCNGFVKFSSFMSL